MIARKKLQCSVFEDEERARKYSKESGKWMEGMAREFIAAAHEWGISRGRILDVGTGPGVLAIAFARNMPEVEVVGLDLSEVVLAVAEENAQKNGVSSRVSFERGDAQDMPFDSVFDLVISSNTLHLVENPVNMFNEIQRVLKPGGKFFMSDFRRSFLGLLTAHIRASYSLGEVSALLAQSDLEDWQIKDSFLWLKILSAV
ncbi:MAG: class I SAM-dependent methyltransferase [Theionarchaea archaeon]|nr:class I SAM-dependent methyltransferase [Theionarchaea archaeon]MBU7000807.1 class I SAM-dependent methyltransferase [Theionarchaea archaeon]MBU7022031.1 class I SAM-dependent methyltransferase [Theionarchaea archaeon]MBU7034712.1 class I SAM-dependent methyltransferase [Theionarchaea archaeon]MBU7041700.1 class I SAM-dependent methyltransferase [Theionarchaea archaeon]